jgi:hypothetical protein
MRSARISPNQTRDSTQARFDRLGGVNPGYYAIADRLNIPHRRAEEPAVLAIELAYTLVAHLICRISRIETVPEHSLACNTQPKLLLELHGLIAVNALK